MGRTWPGLVVAGLLLAGFAACTGAPSPRATSGAAPAATPSAVRWTPLPGVPGARSLTRVAAGGGVLLVSGTRGEGDGAPPALWRRDGRGGWRPVELAPATYYGRRAELVRVVTDGRRVVALGRRIGGTHGNPRFTSWTGTVTSLRETVQPFELFGGPDAISVNDLALGDGGGVVIGAWSHRRDPSGVAVWLQHGRTWQRLDGQPGLASTVTDVGSDLTSPGAVAWPPGGPVLVGWTVHLGGGQVTLHASLWLHDAPAWRELRLPAQGDAQARAVACDGDRCTVLGSVEGRLALWTFEGGRVGEVRDLPEVALTDRDPVAVARTGSTAWVAVGAGATSSVLRVDGGAVRAVSAPPGAITSMVAMSDGPGTASRRVVALVHAQDGSTSLWQAAD